MTPSTEHASGAMSGIPDEVLNVAKDVVDVIVAPQWSWDRPHAVQAVAEAILAESQRYAKALRKAVQVCEITADAYCDGVEIDGEMVSLYDLKDEFTSLVREA